MRYPIIYVDQPGHIFGIQGDHVETFSWGVEFDAVDSTGNDGTYTSYYFAPAYYNAGEDRTEILINESIPSPIADGDINYGPSPGTAKVAIATQQYIDDGWKSVVFLDSDGSIEMSAAYGGGEDAFAAAFDPLGNIVVGGDRGAGSVEAAGFGIDGTPLWELNVEGDVLAIARGQTAVYMVTDAGTIAKVSPSGNRDINWSEWAVDTQKRLSNYLTCIAVDADGNVYVGGNRNSSYWGGGASGQKIANIWKLKPDGTLDTDWGDNGGVSLGGENDWDRPQAIAIDSDGNVWAVGKRMAGYDGGQPTDYASAWKLDGFDGSVLVALDTDDTLYAVATKDTDAVLAGKQGTLVGGSTGTVWKVDTDGFEMWAFDGTYDVYGVTIDTDADSEDVFITGTRHFGTGSAASVWKLGADGNYDISWGTDGGVDLGINCKGIALQYIPDLIITEPALGASFYRGSKLTISWTLNNSEIEDVYLIATIMWAAKSRSCLLHEIETTGPLTPIQAKDLTWTGYIPVDVDDADDVVIQLSYADSEGSELSGSFLSQEFSVATFEPTLKEVTAEMGFAEGDLDTSGYVAVIPAFQKVYFADGRDKTKKGYHKLDMVNTKLTGIASADFDPGEVITQAGTDAQGIYDENPDKRLYDGNDTISGTFTIGELVTQATSEAKGFVHSTADESGHLAVYVYPISGTFNNTDQLTGDSSGATMTPSAVSAGKYHLIYRTTVTEFTTAEITGANSAATMTPESIAAPPHWLYWSEKAGFEGLPEGGANIGCLCFGRIFLNSILNPNQWYACRPGEPGDWLTGQDDVGTPISSQTSKAGVVGDALVVYIPYQDHYLIFGCANQVWIMRSDPAAGGTLTNLSMTTGIFSPQSWCWDDKGNLYFIGNDGLYILPVGAAVEGQAPENLTHKQVPNLVKAMQLNRRTDRVTLKYDKQRHGIVINAVQMDGAWSASLWYDLRTGGIFPEKYNADHVPASVIYYDNRRADYRGILLGGQDGYIRRYDETQKSDDGDNPIESHVVLGPIQMSNLIRGQGKLTELAFRLSERSDSLDYQVYTADASEELVNNIKSGAAPAASGIFTGGGRKNAVRPRSRGAVLALKLFNNNAGESWAIEKLKATITQAGKIKGV